MARKDKNTVEAQDQEHSEIQEQEQEQEQEHNEASEIVQTDIDELTTEEMAIHDALNSDDVFGSLAELKTSEKLSDIAKTIISTYIALSNALGEDAPATLHALKNLQEFKSTKVKAPKSKKEPKIPKFNEASVLKEILAMEAPDFSSLLENSLVSDGLKIAITTYTTLASIEDIDESVLATSLAGLTNFGKKPGNRGKPIRTAIHVQAGDTVYTTLCGALEVNGLTKLEIITDDNGKTRSAQDLAWRTIRPKLVKGESIEYKGVTYSPVKPTDDAVSIVSKGTVEPEVEPEVEA